MRDRHSVDIVAKLHPKIRDEVKALIEKAEEQLPENCAIRIAQGLRTIEEQNYLYSLGRTNVNPDGKSIKKPYGNIVTNAKGGSSFHNYGLGLDFCLVYKDAVGKFTISWDMKRDQDKDGLADWKEVVTVFVAGGFEWGGNWHTIVDNPHFQKTFGHTWQQLFAKYKPGQYVDL